jgi:hypothetical protein
MKNCNQIVFVVSFFMFSSVVAMEVVPAEHKRWYIDINKDAVEQFVGGSICYNDEHQSREFHKKNIISFPVECTDPLPIEYCGDKRFFKTSTMALAILDPEIKQLAIVRAVQSNNNCIDIYLGLETDKVKLLGNRGKRIYPAKVLAFQIHRNDTQFECWQPQCFTCNEVAHFGIMQIIEEVTKQFPETKTRHWNDILVRALVKKLLGRCAQDFNFQTLQFNF